MKDTKFQKARNGDAAAVIGENIAGIAGQIYYIRELLDSHEINPMLSIGTKILSGYAIADILVTYKTGRSIPGRIYDWFVGSAEGSEVQ